MSSLPGGLGGTSLVPPGARYSPRGGVLGRADSAAIRVGWLGVLAVGLLALLGAGPAPDQRAGAALEAYGKLPLVFVPNVGQTDARVRYSAQAPGAGFYFTPTETTLALTKGKKGLALRLAFLGANPAPGIEGERLGPGKVNYLIGNDPSKWRTNLPTYEWVV